MTDLAKAMFLLSCIVTVFAYGVTVGRYHVFPYSIISRTVASANQVLTERDTLLGLRPSEFIEPARYEGSGVTRLQSDRMVPGLTFLTGFVNDGNEMWLVAPNGAVVHRWRVKFFDIFPDPRHIIPAAEIPNGEWNVAVHGSHLLPDGSVVFNFTYKGAAKVDPCGEVLWAINRMTHHAIDQSADGGFWIPAARYIETEPQYPYLQVPYTEDSILKVSTNGEVLEEISVLEILFRNNLQGLLYKERLSGDLTHLNDVEELDTQMARSFPLFQAGDLLLSMKFQDLVMVVDPQTLEVKWWQVGPWIGQHDPDFVENGKISVFSNNNHGTETKARFGGSSILEVDPVDRRILQRYGGRAEQPMFTVDRGKHQRLGDGGGSILITESRAGRIFEVDRNGEVVWEYVNRYDDENVTVMTGATRYPEDYFTVGDWSCD